MTTQAPAHEPMHVCREVGTKRVLACALERAGWCRSAKTEADALAVLAAYAARYAVVAREAGLAFPGTQQTAFHIVERRAGAPRFTPAVPPRGGGPPAQGAPPGAGGGRPGPPPRWARAVAFYAVPPPARPP